MFDFMYKKYEKSKDAIIIYKKNGDIRYINKSAKLFFKYPENVKPKTVFDFMNKDQQILHKQGMRNKNIKAICFDSSIIYIDITILPGSVLVIKMSNEERFKDYIKFFDDNTVGMMISDNSGIMLKVNSSFCLNLGYTREQLIGKNFLDHVYPKDLKDTLNIMKTFDITKKLTDYKNRYINSEGEIVYFSWNAIENDGKYYASAENITEKIKISDSLYKSNQYLEEIEKISKIGYWEWCISDNSLVWSSGLKDIYELYEPAYETYMDCNYEDDIPSIKETIEKCLLDKKKYTIIHRVIKNKSKEVIWIKAVGKIIIKEDKEYLIGIVQDITEEHNREENYKIQKEKALETSNIKSKFVASVSHELRTPLNGIIGMVSLLGMTELTQKQDKYIKILDSSCGVLLSIINNVLDFSKIESGKIVIDYNSFNVENSINEIVELFKPSAVSKNIVLTTSFKKDFDNIMSDEVKIKQIISNLLSNSIKFTKKGSISVDVILIKDRLDIQVSDTGMGISGQFLKKISEPFTQENANSTHGGSGLGMSIIKSYLDILKGTIVIDSELGVGTKVLVRIPVHKSDYKKVIVVIEDNYANSFILKEMITEVTDYLVEIYEDGQVYIDNLEKQQPLLIFMDLHMPRLDGVDTTKYLRENGYTCPIVAVTANNLKSEKVRGYDAGITDFIIKPVSVSNIKDCLVRHIK